MKFLRFFIRGAILFLTAIWGIMFGIVGNIPALMSAGGKNFYIIWTVMAAAGFIIPCFLIMFERRKTAVIALVCSVTGNIIVFVMYQYSAVLFSGNPEYETYAASRAEMFYYSLQYSPQILMTVFIAAYIFLLKKTKWRAETEKERIKPAKSILK
jgi:hypothetical protein